MTREHDPAPDQGERTRGQNTATEVELRIAERAGSNVVDQYPETLRRLGEVQTTSSGPAPSQGERDGLAERLDLLSMPQAATYEIEGQAFVPEARLIEAIRIARAALLTSTEGPTRVDRDDIVRLTEIRNDWQRKPSRYRDDANLLTRILAALTREAESVRAEATLAAIRAHAGTIWDAHDCKTAAVTYFDGEDAGRNHALTRDESSTEGGARLCRHDSTRVDGWLDDHCLRCGSAGYFKDGRYVDPTGKPSKGHPSGKTLIWPAQSEEATTARVEGPSVVLDEIARAEGSTIYVDLRIADAAEAGRDSLDEPASPTPQEQEQIDPELYRQCEDAGHPPVTPGSSCHCGLRPQEQVGGPALSHSGEKGRGDALAQAVEDYIATWQPPHASQMEEALLAYLRTPTEGAE